VEKILPLGQIQPHQPTQSQEKLLRVLQDERNHTRCYR
jgi:hypothetical protein